MFPNTYAQTIVIASTCVGFTFPGIIELPGSFSGNNNSPKPLLGPEPRNLISFEILCREVANVAKEAWYYVNASLVANASNLFGAELNFMPRFLLSSSQTCLSKF